MNLINVTQSVNGMTVDGRELHEFLEVGRDFTTWIQERIGKYGFVEGEDYSPVSGRTSENGGRPRTDYELSIEMAKELCMVENNEKGRQARKYFIECERRLKNTIIQPQLPQNYKEALIALVGQVEENERLQSEKLKLASRIEEDKPKVQFAETCMTSDRSILVREVAKLASKQGFMIGERRLFQKLRDWGMFVQHRNEPTQRAMEMGLFEIKKGVYAHPDGARDYATPKVTVKGQMYIINRLTKEAA